MKKERVNTFLKLGYFLDYENPKYSVDFSNIDKDLYKDSSVSELVEKASELFLNSVEKKFCTSQKHVVPISGGLDSRAILGALLEFTDASNIYTYTFGTPGTLDYEIGCQVGKTFGTKHTSFPLTQNDYSMDELINISHRVDHQTVLFHHAPVYKLDQVFNGYEFWSGYFGDPLVGSHYNKKYPTKIEEAIPLFLKLNQYQSDISITLDVERDLSNLLYVERDINLSTMEQLDFKYRQLKFVAPHVLMKGFKYQTPFMDEELFNFFLSIDNAYRENQFLYKKMLIKTFPKLFSYPVKNNYGLPLSASRFSVQSARIINKIRGKLLSKKQNRFINYLDFDVKIREKEDLRNIIKNCVEDLAERDFLDLDPRDIFSKHVNQQGNYGRILILLASLEIHNKSMEKYGEVNS